MNIVFWLLIILILIAIWILLCFTLPIESIVDKIINTTKSRIYGEDVNTEKETENKPDEQEK